MSRAARVVAVGIPHHVAQRGNRGAEVFLGDEDYQQYLAMLAKYAELAELQVWAYCLMTNHVHLIALPLRPDSLATTLRPLQTMHSRRVNARLGHSGHLWQSRYFSCPMEDKHLWAAVRYVERNPVRAGIVARADEYPWSSAAPHCGLRGDPVLQEDLRATWGIPDWAEWLSAPEDEHFLGLVRRRTMKGIPCGDEVFVERISRMIGRPIRDRPRGRPRKGQKGDRHDF